MHLIKILSVKEEINKLRGHAVNQQKLIFSGKILQDSSKISECSMKEGDFMVLMVTKTVTAKTSATSNEMASNKEEKHEEKKKEEEQNKKVRLETNNNNINNNSNANSEAASVFLSGTELDAAVKNLMDMGFEESKVRNALRQAFNNPDRAVEYLMGGGGGVNIPSSNEQQQQPSTTSSTANNFFTQISGNQQFRQLRSLVQQQPQMLEPVLQQLGQSNPQLVQFINQNQEAFMEWLSEGDESALDEMDENEEGGAVGGGNEPPSVVISLTNEEQEAVERLASLGFDRSLAIEAYLACDKNETLAANYLFDSNNFE
jgi:UV excision repair protein RAD23